MRNRSLPDTTVAPIVSMGAKAHSVLSAGGYGKVLAATSRVIYLTFSRQELLWLTSSGEALHPRGIRMAGSLPDVPPETECIAVGGRLVLDVHNLDYSSAAVWLPVPLRSEDVLPPDRLAEHLASVIPCLAQQAAPAGFGVLIPSILGHFSGHPTPPAIPAARLFAARAWPMIRDILDSCLAGNFASTLRRADDLIGLGEGLTPSGDDFVGALLYWLARVREHRAGSLSLDLEVVEEFLRRSRPRTNVISHVLLADHARGHACDALRHFVNGLLTGQKSESLARRVAQLIPIGHSTGWDMLAGVVAGAMVTSRIHSLGWPVRRLAPILLSNERG